MTPSMDNNSNFALATALKQAGVKLKATLFATGYEPDVINSPVWSTLQGDYFLSAFRPWSLPNAGTQQMQAAMEKYAHFSKTQFATFGQTESWLGADLMIKGLQMAGANPTRAAVIKDLRSIKAYNGNGLLPITINYSTIFGHDPRQLLLGREGGEDGVHSRSRPSRSAATTSREHPRFPDRSRLASALLGVRVLTSGAKLTKARSPRGWLPVSCRMRPERLGRVLDGEAVCDHGPGDVGIVRQHGRGVLHLATAFVGAIPQGGDEPGLAMEEGHPVELHRAEVHAEDDDRATGRDQFGAAGKAVEGPGRLDHDVIEPLGVGASAEALPRLLLVGVTCLQNDLLGAEPAGPGHSQQPEGAGSHHGHPLAGRGVGQTQGMPGD